MSADRPISVAVAGCAGRMGSLVADAVREADDMLFCGGADPAAAVAPAGGPVFATSVPELLKAVRPDVVVDFSVPGAVFENARAVLDAGVACVVGATGLGADQRAVLGTLAEAKGVGVLVAPNFAVGAVLMMEFARQAAKFFSGAEVIELHHERKLDAPSGTALMTAARIAAARGDAAQRDESEYPARGQSVSGVPVHSVRLPGLVAHQEVLFGNPGEGLIIRHDSYDRKSFMPGVLLGIRRILERKGLVYGLESFLFE